MIIGIIGKGFVGNAISEGFKTQGHEIVAHDIRLETKIEDVLNTPIVYISVPTPSAPNGDCDTNIVESVLSELNDLKYKGVVCVKSTVKPGSIGRWKHQFKSLNINFVPEFLREKCAVEDFIHNNNVLVIGASPNNNYYRNLITYIPRILFILDKRINLAIHRNSSNKLRIFIEDFLKKRGVLINKFIYLDDGFYSFKSSQIPQFFSKKL